MHELALTQEIIAIVSETARGARVTRVVLEIGKLALVLPDAIRFCFDLCSNGTVAEGASLEIVEIPAMARCRECGADVELEQAFGRCGCGGTDLEWLSGDELNIKEMELASDV
jgi:hydrogenase nickel incorporation protein HypA/HybF